MSFLGLSALIPVRASEASNVITDQAKPPGDRSKAWYGFEVVPTFSLPLPVASANRKVIGLDAGLGCTVKLSPIFGVGANVAYHYWPVSAENKQEFSEFLRYGTFNILKLGPGTWGVQVVEVGGHIRACSAATRGVRPWLQVGMSAYRVDPNISGYSGNAGFFTVVVPPFKSMSRLGYSVALGTDLFGGPSARMGLDATYHYVDCRDLYGIDLQALTLGAHLVLGW